MAVSTSLGTLFLHELLGWRCLNPHPWEEQNPLMDQIFLIAIWRSLGIFWSLVASAPVLGDLGLGEEEESLISMSNFLMALYCFEVVAVRHALASVCWKSMRPMLVVASATGRGDLRWLGGQSL